MKKNYSLLVFAFLISFSLIFLIAQNTKPQNPVSPLPNFLTLFENKQVSTINLWMPFIKNFLESKLNKPVVSAKSALIYDLTSNKVLFEKNSKERLPIASLTKIVTAVVALENKRQNDEYIVRKEDLIGEDMIGLSEGEILSLKELLYGLILHSANDSAETIANNYPQGRVAFIKAMNAKVASLGLFDTNFINPTGLEGDGKQYSTSYDLLIITKFALNFSMFREVVSTFDYQIPYTKNHKAFYLENETNLLISYPGVKGVKTGYTPEAGLCLVTYLEYGGHRIIGVILNSDNRREEMKELLDYSLKALGIKPPPHN